MSLHDDIIRRWLDAVADDAAPRLERTPAEGEVQEDVAPAPKSEAELQEDRLRLVQGILSTLDLRSAPKELDARVEALAQDCLACQPEESNDLDEPQWAAGLAGQEKALDSVFGAAGLEAAGLEALEAPEFLDRIVEQRLAGMQASSPKRSSSQGSGRLSNPMRKRGPLQASRTLIASAALLLALVAVPLYLGEKAGYFGAGQSLSHSNVRLVNYDSLEGLQKAFPNQSQVANGMGILGAFGSSAKIDGGPR